MNNNSEDRQGTFFTVFLATLLQIAWLWCQWSLWEIAVEKWGEAPPLIPILIILGVISTLTSTSLWAYLVGTMICEDMKID